MLRLLKKLWNWIRSLFGKKPPISGDRENEPQPEPTDLEYENTLMALLEQVDQGRAWSQLLVFLMGTSISKEKLAKWLKGKGKLWLQTPANYQELGHRLGSLAAVATGDLADIAHFLNHSLCGRISKDASPLLWEISEDEAPTEINDTDMSAIASLFTGDPVQILIDYVVQQYENDNYQAAYDLVCQITQRYPDDYRGWLYLGKTMEKLEQYEEALASYEKALQINIDDDEILKRRGFVLLYLGKNEEALASFNQALEFNLNDQQIWYNRGLLLLDLGKNEEALVSFNQVLEFKPDHHQAWYNRGVALLYLGTYQEALASFDQALSFKPDYYEAWLNRGNALDYLGRNEEALASFKQAAKFTELKQTDYI